MKVSQISLLRTAIIHALNQQELASTMCERPDKISRVMSGTCSEDTLKCDGDALYVDYPILDSLFVQSNKRSDNISAEYDFQDISQIPNVAEVVKSIYYRADNAVGSERALLHRLGTRIELPYVVKVTYENGVLVLYAPEDKLRAIEQRWDELPDLVPAVNKEVLVLGLEHNKVGIQTMIDKAKAGKYGNIPADALSMNMVESFFEKIMSRAVGVKPDSDRSIALRGIALTNGADYIEMLAETDQVEKIEPAVERLNAVFGPTVQLRQNLKRFIVLTAWKHNQKVLVDILAPKLDNAA